MTVKDEPRDSAEGDVEEVRDYELPELTTRGRIAMMLSLDSMNSGLWLWRGFLPVFLAVPMILFHWAGQPAFAEPLTRVVVGGLVGLAAYVATGIVSGPSATASASNVSVFSEQWSRIDWLDDACRVFRRKANEDRDSHARASAVEQLGDVKEPSPEQLYMKKEIALTHAEGIVDRTYKLMRRQQPAQGWASQESYIGVWSDIHRAEEALLQLRDPGLVRAEAKMDLLRVRRSTMGHREQLATVLKKAISELDVVSAGPAPSKKDDRKASDQKTDHLDPVRRRAKSVDVIQAVRTAINEYRDDRAKGLVRLRLNLRRWELALGFTIYALFAAAVLTFERESYVVQSFAAYYLIGAATGLLAEAWRRRRNRPAVEDFGLTRARVRLSPLVSGTAACAGVFLVAILLQDDIARITSALDGPLESTKFVLVHNPGLAIAAAVFGLAPGRLLGAVDRVGERLERDISASEKIGAETNQSEEEYEDDGLEG